MHEGTRGNLPAHSRTKLIFDPWPNTAGTPTAIYWMIAMSKKLFQFVGSSVTSPFVEVIEVGTRDGLQIEKKIIPTEQKIEIINAMIDAGIRNFEVTSFVSPKAVPQLADAEQVLAGIDHSRGATFTALVPNLRAAERACKTPLTAGVLLCSASNTHNWKNLNRTLDESLAEFPAVAKTLRDSGIKVQGTISTSFGCPFEGEVPFANVLRIARIYAELGARDISICDTTGMATPVLVQQVSRAIMAELPEVRFALHLHNTRGVGLANVLAGLDVGIRRFDSSVGGLGGCPFAPGATGNICTEDLLYLLAECGYETGVDLDKAIAVAFKLEKCLGKSLSGQVMRAGPRLQLHDPECARRAEG